MLIYRQNLYFEDFEENYENVIHLDQQKHRKGGLVTQCTV